MYVIILFTQSYNSLFRFPFADGEILRVLVNTSAQIKCDVGSSLPDDKVLLVVWYKNNLPIYSYDTRGAHAGTPSHWRDEEVLEDRAVFRTHKEPAELIINPVKEKDAGNFRCRVDFKLSQTRNSNVNLEVVVPPQQPTIFNERRMKLDSRAGPYEEGGSLEVTCLVFGDHISQRRVKFSKALISTLCQRRFNAAPAFDFVADYRHH
ncbi:unnamed protein product [Ceratitis capitata]|uniref:(Mediterranean fruit fly) hypothetical protein n=1 Tax=Ceratitis capitata TaxID=7213 RepID=A0A811UDA3_CERCA|nr:unnamed protein product [Ceratitis capitata]